MISENNQNSQNLALLGEIYNCIDSTTLSGDDTQERIDTLCKDALTMSSQLGHKNHVAAVCVYPVFVRQAKRLLTNTPIKVASVAGAFPSGQSPLSVKLQEIRYAIEEGADEIDMVISRGTFLEGNLQQVFDEIAAIREVAARQTLKVILETGELRTPENIRKASECAIEAGADFIKTSTGKIAVGATLEAAQVMLQVIKDHYQKTGKMVGFKAAGGISTPEQALQYANLAHNIMGDEFLTNTTFRIGASRLTTALFAILTKKTTNN